MIFNLQFFSLVSPFLDLIFSMLSLSLLPWTFRQRNGKDRIMCIIMWFFVCFGILFLADACVCVLVCAILPATSFSTWKVKNTHKFTHFDHAWPKRWNHLFRVFNGFNETEDMTTTTMKKMKSACKWSFHVCKCYLLS